MIINKFKFFLIGCFSLTAFISYAQQSGGYTINAKLIGLKDSTQIFLTHNNSSNTALDTVATTLSKKGAFSFSGRIPLEGEAFFIKFDSLKYKKKLGNILLLLENRVVSLEGSIDRLSSKDIKVTGSPIHSDYVEFSKQEKQLADSLELVYKSIYENYAIQEKKDQKVFVSQLEENIAKPKKALKEKWIASHPNSLLTPWIILKGNFSFGELKNYYDGLGQYAKASKFGTDLYKMIKQLERLEPGAIPPNFTFDTPEGNALSLLETIKNGKITVVDFWASWCKPCRSEFIELKKIYKRYQDKGLVIIGFSVDDYEKNWKDAILKDSLQWLNVRQTNNQFAKLNYDVERLPSNLVLDNSGRIIARNVDVKALEKILEEKLSELIDNTTMASYYAQCVTVDKLKEHVYVLSSKEMEGRGLVSAGQRKAANYIIGQFKRTLKPGVNGKWQQHLPVCYDTVTRVAISIDGKRLKLGTDFHYSLELNKKTQIISANEIIFAGFGFFRHYLKPDYNSYEGIDVKDKIVLVLGGEPKYNDSMYVVSGKSSAIRRSTKAEYASMVGAKAVLEIDDDVIEQKSNSTLVYGSDFYIPGISSKKINDRVNTYYISTATASKMLNKSVADINKLKKLAFPESFTVKKTVKILYDIINKKPPFVSTNILGIVEGSDKKDEYVFVTAHYDHRGKFADKIFYGADDNASGTSAILEIATAFAKAKKEGNGPRRSIVFMAVSCEENSTLGSAYYSENPVYPLDKTVVNLNVDMVGRTGYDYEQDKDSVNYVYTIGDDSLSTELKLLNEKINTTYTKMKLDNTDKASYYTRSDHYNFAKRGIPVIFYTNGVHKDYHCPTDTPDKINYELLRKRTQLVFLTAWEIANREERLKIDKKPAALN